MPPNQPGHSGADRPSRLDSLNMTGDDFWLDLGPAPNGEDRSTSDASPSVERESKKDPETSAKMKRIACILCRKRKLKCDGTKPSCGTCSRLGHNCAYDEVRRKSGPKRGYVKALEARLAQVETLLKTQDPNETTMDGNSPLTHPSANANAKPPGSSVSIETDFLLLSDPGNLNLDPAVEPLSTAFAASTDQPGLLSVDEPFSWDMIALGLEEPLPSQTIIDELNKAYFEKVHHSLPMIHRPRFLAAMDLAPHMRPPICLRYAMWALAAGTLDKYEPFEEQFYHRSRKYIQLDELRGHGESIITLAHTQTWILLCMYEVKHMYFPRSWLSTGRAVRLAQMLGLHRLDGVGLDVKQCLPPPRDWTEREERRRTFWAAYSEDRCASIGTGWPMTIEEQDILTNLPASEDAFQNNRPMRTMSLSEATESNSADFSSFAGVALMSTLFGRNLTHLHRPSADDNDDDLNGAFWKRHRSMDSILLNKALALPDYLRLPAGISDPNVIFLNMCIHTSAICLHQAAIFKADKNQMPPSIATESKVRCITAAAEVASIMRSVCHMDLTMMNPFMAFCLYVAARVFIQYLKSRPNDQQILCSLQFLLSAMHALKRKNPLTESFLVQLEVDMEGTGIEIPNNTPTGRQTMPFATRVPFEDSGHGCSPLINIREAEESLSNTMNEANKSGKSAPVQFSGGRGGLEQPELRRSFQVVDMNASNPRSYLRDSANARGAQESTRQNGNPPAVQKWPSGMPANSLRTFTNASDISQSEILSQNASEGIEMDLSPDNSASNLTPSSTSQQDPSSHSSFTPPEHTHDLDGNQKSYVQGPKDIPNSDFPNVTKTSAPANTAGTIPFFNSSNFNPDNFVGLDPSLFPPTPNMDHDGCFALPQGWDFGSTGLTPGATTMTPNNETPDAWNIMMQGMSGWDSGPTPTQTSSWNRDGAR